MATQFTPCSACGALGEVGEMCQFCGTTIELKEGAILSNTRLVHHRTITPQQYADKISIYHKVKKVGTGVLSVSIGKQFGLINLNGDLIYPLGDYEIIAVRGNIIEFNERKSRYLNLENGQFADYYGFVADEDNTKRLHRVDIENNWKPINTYVNLNGHTYSLDYAEYLDIYDVDTYIFHSGAKCALYIPELDLSEYDYSDEQECIIDGIDKIAKSKKGISITTQNLKGIAETLVITEEDYMDEEEIFDTLCEKLGILTPLDKAQQELLAEKKSTGDKKRAEEKEKRDKERKKYEMRVLYAPLLFFAAVIIGIILLFKILSV